MVKGWCEEPEPGVVGGMDGVNGEKDGVQSRFSSGRTGGEGGGGGRSRDGASIRSAQRDNVTGRVRGTV